MIPTYRIALVGDSGVGKTSWLLRHTSGNFYKTNMPTHSCEIHSILMHTNVAHVRFEFIDCAGSHMEPDYLFDSHAAIIMFDITAKSSLDHVRDWSDLVRRTRADIPIILCGNKVDIHDWKVTVNDIRGVLRNAQFSGYYTLSANTCYNFERPLQGLARILTGYESSLLQVANSPPREYSETILGFDFDEYIFFSSYLPWDDGDKQCHDEERTSKTSKKLNDQITDRNEDPSILSTQHKCPIQETDRRLALEKEPFQPHSKVIARLQDRCRILDEVWDYLLSWKSEDAFGECT